MILICPECGVEFTRTQNRQVFCTTAHKTKFYNVQAKRGITMGPLLQAWRLGKNGRSENASWAFGQVCAMIDIWNAEDRACGRRSDLIVTAKREIRWAACDVG